MNKKLISLGTLLVIVVIALAVNLIGAVMFRRARIDMTEEKLYTLSPGSVNIAQGLKDRVTIKLYCSNTAIASNSLIKLFAERVTGMLREFAAVSKGKIKFEIIDPRPDTEDQEWAERYGITPVARGDNQEMIYLGLVMLDENGGEKAIPGFDPRKEETLEYDIAKTLYSVSNKEKKKVGLLAGINAMGEQPNPMARMNRRQQPENPWVVIQELRNVYKIETIDKSAKEIPKDIELLLVIHPKDFSDALQYAIDQYILRGGKALVFVDPFCEADQAQMAGMMNPQMQAQASFASNLPKLFKSWGIEMIGKEAGAPDESPFGGGGGGPAIVGDPKLAAKVQMQNGSIMELLIWMTLGAGNRNSKEIVTNELDNVVMASPGGLKTIAPAGGERDVTPLLYTSDKGGTIDAMTMRMMSMGMGPDQLLKQFKAAGAPVNLAVKITGKFKTAFPAGRPADGGSPEDKKDDATSKTADKDPNFIGESKQPGYLIVVADVDMLTDKFAVNIVNLFGQKIPTAINDNLSFVGNAVENLSGSNDLIALRSRGRIHRPFTRVQEIAARAQEQWRQKAEEWDKKVQAANDELRQLQETSKDKKILDKEFMARVEKLRQDRAQAQKALREVKRNLREDVERLGAWIKFINIVLLPILVVAAGAVVYSIRYYRRRTLS